MPITIGEQALATNRPTDLDDQLIATTGCTAAENSAMLKTVGAPFQIARALKPMLTDDDRSLNNLAVAISAADTLSIRQSVIALLAPPEPAIAPADPIVGG